jgi:hypothetical protein
VENSWSVKSPEEHSSLNCIAIELRRHARIGTNDTAAACALVKAGARIALVERISVRRLFPALVQRLFRPQFLVSLDRPDRLARAKNRLGPAA